MILVIDVGNTRLKWAWLTSTGLSDQQAVVHRDAKPGIWTTALFKSGQRPSRVLVSNVAGPVMAKTLARLTKRNFRVDVEFVTAAREFHGLTSGYLDPSLLGADRWLALIGAWTRARTALCVVDAGTAVKVDSVDLSGQHLGGLIAPGIHMMREVLMSNTSDIAKASLNSSPSLAGILANNTIAAVSRGAVFALAGMADRAAEVIEQSTGSQPKLFITGGDASIIAGTMRTRGEIVPDLVLQGLAVIAAQPR
ncbi:MAG: type pantothenate kinase [Gammaproteobacteria bacterium]|jgi:type III pantothenate kinase|nr:type pantothenate kinase [Gammaproteobacteria bacterium]MEA3138907.1 type pantothenate kinase [Gammaproteobacteria bacterium]